MIGVNRRREGETKTRITSTLKTNQNKRQAPRKLNITIFFGSSWNFIASIYILVVKFQSPKKLIEDQAQQKIGRYFTKTNYVQRKRKGWVGTDTRVRLSSLKGDQKTIKDKF